MREMLENICKQALDSIAEAKQSNDLEAIRVKYLGKKGQLTQILRGMGKLSPEERPVMGQLANQVRGTSNRRCPLGKGNGGNDPGKEVEGGNH